MMLFYAQDSDGLIRRFGKVVMWDNKGNKWIEPSYDGSGVFGGKDYYQLLAEMNNLPVNGDVDHDRALGIELESLSYEYISPNLTHEEGWVWEDEHPIKALIGWDNDLDNLLNSAWDEMFGE